MSLYSQDVSKQVQEVVEHLRVQATMNRSKLSSTLSDMIEYTEKNIHDDPLIVTVKDNPFKAKKGLCNIL